MEDPAAIERAVELHAAALSAVDEGRLDEARALACESLAIFERESGRVHPDVANVLNCLARIDEDRADYARAAEHASRSVAVMREVRLQAGGADIDRLFVQSLAAAGDMQRILGRYEAAERLLREALTIAGQGLPDDDADLGAALNSLGMLFKYSGRFDEAATLYARAIVIAERAGDTAALASLFHNVGGLAHARGDYAQGEAPARRSVELRERALGPDHPMVAADLAALAAIVEGLGRYDEAEAIYLRALATFERVHGPGHYEVAVTLNNLAGIRESQGRHQEAEDAYRRALAIKRALFGPRHPDVAMTENNLALLLAEQGRGREAEPLYRQAIDTFASALDRGHPKIRAAVQNYTGLLRGERRDAEAGALLARHGIEGPDD